jgi:hypothetical protein
MVQKKYLDSYKKFNANYQTYLLADSHGESLAEYPNKYNIYNFSAQSESYFDILRKIDYLIANTEVKRIVMTVDNHTLSPYREELNNMDRSVLFANGNSVTEKATIWKQKIILKTFPVFAPKSRELVKRVKLKYFLDSYYNDKEIQYWSNLSEEKRQKESLKRAEKQFNYSQKSKNLENTLLEIIEVCKSHNIELIGIKFPLTEEYIIDTQSRNFGADQILVSNNIPVLDFTDLYKDNPEFFENQDHLNQIGGEKFSKHLSFYLESFVSEKLKADNIKQF